MKSPRRLVFATPILLCACLGSPDGPTLAELHDVPADLEDVEIEDGIAQAISGYRRFLEEAPRSRLTPEAMRRLADLELEKDFGILGRRAQEAGTGASPAAPASVADPSDSADSSASGEASGRAPESDARFERRATSLAPDAGGSVPASPDLPGDTRDASAGPLEAIALYDRILEKYPDYAQNDEVLYQKARAYEELGRIEEAMAVTARLLEEYPESRHRDEIRFRRGESFFVRRKYLDAEREYASVVREGAASDYYELAIYKLGWALYKQMMLEEALDQYLALLDHKVSSGYDFEQTGDEAQAARMADTYRVISLCFSELGGPAAVRGFFDAHGSRTYEDRIYRHLAEFYFEKRRYQDAASVYDAFIELHPFHHAAPRFRMRTVEIYEEGGFPRLVLESKEVFAADYGIQAPFWEHFEFDREPEVVRFLKQNLKDLASHHHAGYQEASEPSLARERFAEAERWYRDFLASFSNDPETPAMHHRLADLLLEEQRYVDAAVEYERTAYDYPDHEGAAAAGHAAIFAHREFQKTATGPELESSRRAAVDVTLRFVERFPEHEHAAAALGAAAEDLFTLGRFERAIELGERLVSAYPSAAPPVRRSAWSVVAHSSFELESFARAEAAYARVLDLTEESGESRQAVVDNLAASIYKQGEIARAEGDSRTAATHFMRVAEVAPGSGIRPIADYDAAGAWIALEDWGMASSVLDAFRSSFPEHGLSREATRQLAFVFQEQGDSERAAAEYERVAGEATEPDLRRNALSTAGALYEEAGNPRRALSVYREFVTEFTQPIEELVVVHFNMAEIHRRLEEKPLQHGHLRKIVAIDAEAGDARNDRVRSLAARSALTLAEHGYALFEEIDLSQPFEASLREKQARMSTVLASLERLVDYEVGEVTAAATFYIAETYAELSRALLDSERPPDLGTEDRLAYEMALEEEAFPFEERAIEVHERNLELMELGIFNGWIEKSLAELAITMPGRYAKLETSAGPLVSAETHVYRVPARVAEAAEAAEAAEMREVPEVPEATGATEATEAASVLGVEDEGEDSAPSDEGAESTAERVELDAEASATGTREAADARIP